MKSNGSLQVVPDSISFRELKKGDTDSCDIYVTNIGKGPNRFRFAFPPKSGFILSSEGTFTLAPGLEAKITVKYTMQSEKKAESILRLKGDDTEMLIPVVATPPSARIISDYPKLKLGSIGVETQTKFVFNLTNLGVCDGPFTLVSDLDFVKFNPSAGNLPAGKALEITGMIRPNKIGDISGIIKIDLKDQPDQPTPIEITASAVQHSLALMIKDVEVSELDFQTIFVGQKRVIQAKIVNKGMYKRSFVVLPPQDSPIGSPRSTTSGPTTNNNAPVDDQQVFTTTPSEGLLNAYGSQVLNFVFTPPDDTGSMDDLENFYSQFSSIEVVETGQKIDFQLTGRGVRHIITLSSIDFDFGNCNVQEKITKTLTINNVSHFLPTDFEVNPIAHFRFVPLKGTIEPAKSKEIQITFFPKNLGIFETNTTISFCHNLNVSHINLVGQCGAPLETKFKRIPMWEADDKVRYTVLHPDARYQYGLNEIHRNQTMRSTFDGYLTEQAARRQRLTAISQLQTRSKRLAETALSQTLGQYTEEDVKDMMIQKQQEMEQQENEVELGLQAHEGLQPPEPPLKRTKAPLFLLHPEKFGLVREETAANQNTLNHRRKIHTDDNVLVKKKFKGKPTTPQEINECTRALTPAQQLLVQASHQSINFGQTSVFSTVAKSFTIANNLQQHIIVTMNYEFDEISQSTPVSQVVAPKATAGFDIKFCSKKPHNFMKTISYTINGHHSYSINMSAQVIPIDVVLSRNVIEFRFAPDSISPIIKEFVSLTNKSNGNAEFSWTGMNNSFTLSQNSGIIEGNRMQNIEITYIPTNHPHDEVTLVMNVVGGPSKALKCIGDVGVPKCSVSKKVVNFGLIPIGITKSQTIRIKNSGDDDAIFTVSHQNMSELTITPMNGRIGAHDFQNMQVSFKSLHAHNFDIPVNVMIAGASNISFNITGQSELPQVQIGNTEFEFGKMFVGSKASLEATISNVGAIPAILFLDLSTRPEFRIEYASQYSDASGSDKQSSISLVSDAVFVTKSPSLISMTPSMTSMIPTQPSNRHVDDDANKPQGLVYKFYIVENSSVTFNLVFQPSQVGEHSFELPITMMNVISSNSFHLQPIVSAEAIHAPLVISTNSIDFGVSPIFDPSNPHSRPVVRQLTIQNDYKTPLCWHFDVTNPQCEEGGVFSIEPTKGMIEFAQSQVIHISFTAREVTPYSLHLPVYVKTEKDESLIGVIHLTGIGTSSLFSMSAESVCLPIVPLNIKSTYQVFIINDAFVERSLRVVLPVDENHFPLKITFPDSNILQHTAQKLPINISCISSKPLGFSTIVAIVDDQGNSTSFTVHVTIDNSIFTLYPFINSSPNLGLKSGGGKPIICEGKSFNKLNSLTCKFATCSDIMQLKKVSWEPSCSKMDIEFVLRYLNALVSNSQISDFPGDFIRNEGYLLTEIIANLSNGKRPTLEPDRNEQNNQSADPAVKKRDTLKRLLHLLEAYGCIVSSISPEYLLNKTDFLALMRSKITKQLLGLNKFNSPDPLTFNQELLSEFTSSTSFSEALLSRLKIYDKLFDNLSIECWMMIMMQLFKVFVLGRVDADRFNQTPGVQDTVKQLQQISARFSSVNDYLNEILRPTKNIMASNFYSESEGLLLKWCSMHHCKIMNDLQMPIIEFPALKDSLVYSSLLRSHTTSFHGNMNDHPADDQQRELNAIELTNSIKELKLGFCPRADEIVKGSHCMYAIITYYLFETLPHFLPLSVLDFNTTLHKVITKNVTISNPSKAEITYKAELEGNQNFALSSTLIIVSPNQTVDLPVQFTARTVKPVTGRLFLSPSRPRFIPKSPDENGDSKESARVAGQAPAYSSPIVIDLMSNVTLVAPDGSYTMEGVIYQQTRLQVPIKNLIGTSAHLKLYTKIIQLVDSSGKPVQNSNNIVAQMTQLMQNPHQDNDLPTGDTPFETYVKQHQMFLFSTNTIDFPDANSEAMFEVEFNPISLGTYRCLMLFSDDKAGEFIIDLVAKTTLPSPVEVGAGKLKTESGKKFSYSVPIEIMNSNYVRAVAYSIEKKAAMVTMVSERKFKDLLSRRIHECEIFYKQAFQQTKFTIMNSATQFFEVPQQLTIYKQALLDSMSKGTGAHQTNTLPVVFKPTKAGDYPGKFLLLSKYDIRVYSIKAIGLLATKELSIDFQTVAGKAIKQEIPFQNPSAEVWNFKVTLTGDSSFSAAQRFAIKPGTNYYLSVNFSPFKIGSFNGELSVFNIAKESTVVYKLNAVVEEPPAEEKITIECQARQKTKRTLKVSSNFIKNGKINVTTTIPIITFPSEVEFVNGEVRPDFDFLIYAPRSGLAAGTITFTDPVTKNFIWYIVEVHVDTPAPEQTIAVKTTARKCVTVKIPIANPKSNGAQFSVVLSDDDLFGEKNFYAAANTTTNYLLVVSPLKEMKRTSSVYFYSEDDGEFWYRITIEADKAPDNTVAPLSSAIGKYASTFILLENPLDKLVTFRVENDNQTAFHIVAKRAIQLQSHEKKRIEVRYIPTSVGVKETASIAFKSNETGEWIYKLSGTGKPPQPLSPTIVVSPIGTTNSALVLFTNPFPYPARFSVSMASDEEPEIFNFLVKKTVFTLNNFGEEFQIPFTFNPKEVGQFKAHIIVASIGPARGAPTTEQTKSMPSIRWVYPIMGNSLTTEMKSVRTIRCKSQQSFEDQLTFTLVGETELFQYNEYSVQMQIPTNFEFISNVLDLTPCALQRHDNASDLVILVKFQPQRPLQTSTTLLVKNPLGQEWQFQIDIAVDRGKTTGQIVMESLLNKTGEKKVVVPTNFRVQTPFHAYFVQGSAQEFSVDPVHGFIEPSTGDSTELPVTIIFAPKMYGKVLKGLLVIDTLDAQYLMDVIGKTPEYVPPMIKSGEIVSRIRSQTQQMSRSQELSPKKRNIIRENIENAKITKPKILKK